MSERPRTLYEKIWDSHVVARRDDGTCLIYIDRHLVHEVTSPQAFEGLRNAGRKVRRPDLTLAVADHKQRYSLVSRDNFIVQHHDSVVVPGVESLD